MIKYIAYSLVSVFAIVTSANAYDLGYMVNPTDEARKVPVKVSEVGVNENGQRQFAIESDYIDSELGDIRPAAGSEGNKPMRDPFLGH